jgi:hypothetical protein
MAESLINPCPMCKIIAPTYLAPRYIVVAGVRFALGLQHPAREDLIDSISSGFTTTLLFVLALHSHQPAHRERASLAFRSVTVSTFKLE